MRLSNALPVLLCFGVFLTPHSLVGQTSLDEQLAVDAHQARHLLTPSSPHTTLRIFNLLPGKTYTFLLPADERLHGCRPVVTALSPGLQRAASDSATQSLEFIPTTSTMDFQLDYPCNWDNHPPTHFISIICKTCEQITLKDLQQDMAALTVTKGISPEVLVRDVLVGGECFDVGNITFSGRSSQIGTFANGLSNIGFSDGIIMATGDISLAASPNTVDNADLGYDDATPDANLGTLTSGATYDMANLEFDFTPTQTPVSFEFVFASEEYCEYVNSPFNDVFGFFISGPGITGNGNIALLPSSTIPVAINNVNHLTNSGLFINNTPLGGTLCSQMPATSAAVDEVQFDGFTQKMVATANVVPCQTYHIKLKIADVSDGIFDSAVFLKANSFDAGGNASVNFVVSNDPSGENAYEGCGTVQMVFDRVASNINTALNVQYTISGTATMGVDYAPIPNSIIIPAGQEKLTVPVTILTDALLEGSETLIITLTNLCSCLKPQEILHINELPALKVVADTVGVCGSGIGTLTATPSGGIGPYTYLWSVGFTTPTVSIFAASSASYKVTVTDACGQTKVATARIVVHPLPSVLLVPPAPQLCDGQSSQLIIDFTGTPPYNLQYTLDNVAQTPITGIMTNQYLLNINQTGLYQATNVTDAFGCQGSGQNSLFVLPSTLALTGSVTDVKCNGQTNGSITTVVTGGAPPYTYAWSGPQAVPAIATPTNLMVGQYTVTVTDGFGCEKMQTFTITQPPPLTLAIGTIVGPNCYNPASGSIALNVSGGVPNYQYQWTGGSTQQNPQSLTAGTYTVTVTDGRICTKTAVATVTGNFTPPVASATAPVGLSCRNIPLPLDGTASSTGPGYTYQWTASPGNISAGAMTLIPTVTEGGTYTLVVTSTANGCTAASSVYVTSTVAYPTANAGPDRLLTCSITNVNLDGSGSSQGTAIFYAWTASQGGIILNGDDGLEPVISKPGLYTLIVTDDANGCTAADTVLVSENLTPPTAIIGSPPLLTCVNSSVTLMGGASLPAGAITYQWMTANGNIFSGQTAANAVVTEPGQYTLIVTNAVNNCADTSTVSVNQDNSVPIANAVATDSLDCITKQLTIDGTASSAGSNFSLQWSSSTGSGFVSGQTTLSPVVNAPAIYTLLITNLNNQCTASATVVVGQNIQPPAANAGSPATLTCTADTIAIGDANAIVAANLAYQWMTSGSGHIVQGMNTPTPLVDKPGTYKLTVTNINNGCTSTASVTVNQNIVHPTAVVAPGGEINCTNPTVQLNGAGSSVGATFGYEWTSSTGGGIYAGSNTLTPIVTAAGSYTLVVTNGINGCTASAFTTVTTNANFPIAVATPLDTLTCAVKQIQISAAGSSAGPNFTYTWGTVNGSILDGQGSLLITVGLPATYTLIVTNIANQCSASFAVEVAADLAPPVAEAGANQTLLCTLPNLQLNGTGSSMGADFDYLWSGPGIISGNTTLTPVANKPGTYLLLVTNHQSGCTATDAVQIGQDANDPVVQIAAPGILNCIMTQITLNATGSSVGNNFSYQWNGPGQIVSGTSLMPQVNALGNYVLVITNTTNGCTSTDTVAVTQQVTLPPANAGPDTLLNCAHPQLQIGSPANPVGYTFLWNGPGILLGIDAPQPLINQGGLYSLTVTDTNNGCTAVDQATIATDFLYPQAAAGSGFELTCTQNTYVLNATGSTGSRFRYNWTTDTGNFTTPTDILNPTVNGAGYYYLTVTDMVNGCTATSNVQITKAADVPNSFATTPGILTCSILTQTLSGAGSSSGPAFTYLWSSPDGGNIVSGSTTLNPLINQPGTYNLAVTDTLNHCVSNSSVVVNQDKAAPIINVAASPVLTCTNLVATLQATLGTNGSFIYAWNAQNGGHIMNGDSTLTPVVDAAGTYLLTVTNQQNGCTSTASVPVLVNQVPPVLVLPSPDTLTCTTHEITLTANGSSTTNVEYTWTTSNGHLIGQTTGLQVTADQPGSYVLKIKDLSNGCTSVDSVEITRNIIKPTASAGSNGVLTCAVSSLRLDGSGSSQNGHYFYEWSPANQILTGGNSLLPTVISGGTYTLVVVDSQNGCSATDNTVVTMDTLSPSVAIVSPDLLTCTKLQVTIQGGSSPSGPGINYAWFTTDGHIAGGQYTQQIVVDVAGHYTLNVLNTANGCSSNATTQVNDSIVLPIADAGAPLTLTCSMDEITLQGSGSSGSDYIYSWTATAGGSIISGANTPNPSVGQPGIYQLTVVNRNTGCKQTDQVEIFQEANIPTQFQTALRTPSCKNNDGVITFGTVTGGTGPYLYSIDGGQQFFPALSFDNIAPGTYDLWIQDVNGCEANTTLVVPAAPSVSVSLIPEIKIFLGETAELKAMLPMGFPLALVDTIVWQPLDGLTFNGNDLLSLLHPQAQPFKTTQYTVTVTTVDQCEASARVLVRVDNNPHIYIPNVFSPWDANRNNDVVLIFADGDQIVQVNDFLIFDRWGELVFEDHNFQPNDPKHGWDGHHQAQLMAPAVFVYYAKILLIDGRTLLFKGDITLLR